jgi:NADH-quinone oxidoreductase subunit N
MSAPILWIVIPGLVALALIILRRYPRVVMIIAISSVLLLALLSWRLSIEEVITVGNWAFKIQEQLIVAGRRFVISNNDRPIITFFYISLAFWFIGAIVTPVPRFFMPLGLSLVAVLISALAVDPILYAALLIEVAILIGVLMLVPFGGFANRGVLRFLTYQTLAVPFILIAGWFISGAELQAGNTQDIVRAAIFLGFGFALQLGIFPLHSWIPMLMEKSHPFVAAFVVSNLINVGLFFGVGFLQRYPWLQESLNLLEILRLLGVLMVGVGGIWAAFQRHLGRMFGFAIILEIGRTLLAIGLPQGTQLLFALSLPRTVSMGVWALALSRLKSQTEGLRFYEAQGLGRQLPIASVGLIMGHFSLVGVPILAGFPVYLILWEQLATIGVWLSLGTLIGSVGLLVGGLRSFTVLMMGPEELAPVGDENWQGLGVRLLLLFGVGVMLIMGLIPQWFLPLLTSLSLGLESPAP